MDFTRKFKKEGGVSVMISDIKGVVSYITDAITKLIFGIGSVGIISYMVVNKLLAMEKAGMHRLGSDGYRLFVSAKKFAISAC